MSFKVKISSRTWIKDNYNLFDYDLDKDLNVRELTIKNEGIFSRKLDETIFYNKSKKSGQQNDVSQMTNEDKKLLSIKIQDNVVKVNPPEEKDQLLWKVVPRSENEYVNVDLNDTIKIGKKQFTILQINLSSHKQMLEIENHYHVSNIMNTFISDADMMNSSATSHGESRMGSFANNQNEKQQEKIERMPCRICLSSSCSRKNPLLAPCNCKGSARWIHYDCVQQWINQRIQISEKQHYANIKSRCIKCELCTTLLPPTIKLDDQVYALYQFKHLQFEKFIVLEDADGLIYMLNFTNKNIFNIGRGHNCDIKLSEITVSRKHLKLEVDKDNKIRIYDISSKFGTLVLVKKPLTVQYDQYLELQNGRTHIKLKRIEKKSKLRQFFNMYFYWDYIKSLQILCFQEQKLESQILIEIIEQLFTTIQIKSCKNNYLNFIESVTVNMICLLMVLEFTRLKSTIIYQRIIPSCCKKEETDYPSKQKNKTLQRDIYKDREVDQDDEQQREISRVIEESQHSPNLNNLNSSSQQIIVLPIPPRYQNNQDNIADISQNTSNQANYRANTQVNQDSLSVQRSQSAMVGNRRIGERPIIPQRQMPSSNSSLANFVEIDEMNEQQNRNQINIQQLATQQHQSQPLLMPLSIHQESVNEQMYEDEEAQPTSSRNRINIQQSGSLPIFIPHSNSAPSNFDFIPPPIGFR